MLNRVTLVGRLTKDPELRYTPNGVAVSNFTVAVNRPFTNQEGNRDADFINCVVWRRQAENLANYMKKGNLISVDGRVQTRTYEANDGKTVFVTEILAETISFLEPKSKQQGQNQNPQGQGHHQSNQNYQGNQRTQNYQQNQNQGYQNYQGQQQYQQQPNQMPNNDPYGNDYSAIDISDDDLPF